MAIAEYINSSKGGYDYSFVDTPPDELVCKICQYPSIEPYLSVCCGHTFCRTCLEAAKQVSMVTDTCPLCREKDFTAVPNKQNERAVNSLHVFCTNKHKGCDWQGELNNITRHLSNDSNGCGFERINCSNKCGLSLERRYLSNHVDTECPCGNITCQYCAITGERQFINGQHQEQCLKFPLQCPNKCDIETVPRENMEAHKAECPLEMIQCDYYEVGCKAAVARKDKQKHGKEKMENHLSLMKFEYLHTTNKLEDAEKVIDELQQKSEDTTNKLAKAENMINALQQKTEHITDQLVNAVKKIKNMESANVILQQKTQLVEDMMFKHVFQWHTMLAEKVQSQQNKTPITLRMSEYSKRKKDYSEWNSSCFSWDIPVLQVNPEIKLQAIPAGCDDGKGTHLSLQLYLVKGGCKIDYAHELILLDDEIREFTTKNVLVRVLEVSEQKRKWKQRLEAVEQEIQKCNIACKTQCLCVTILNQISDSEHYYVYTDRIDLETDYFLKNEDCRILIFNSPHFISNEILYTSTATCRYLKDDIIYFSITRSEVILL